MCLLIEFVLDKNIVFGVYEVFINILMWNINNFNDIVGIFFI